MTKLCIDCRHYRPAVGYSTDADRAAYARCQVGASAAPNALHLIDGRAPMDHRAYCETMRTSKHCGEAAILFEPREGEQAA